MRNENRKIKLAMLGPYPIDNNGYIKGGVQAVIVNMVKGLRKFEDLEIHIITADHRINKDVYVTVNGVNIHAVPLDKRFGNISLFLRTRKRICEKLDRISPDLVHTHMFGYYTLAALNSRHKKILVSTHGISSWCPDVRYSITERCRRWFQDCIYKKCANGATSLIINSPYALECMKPFNLKEKNIYDLNNPISDKFFNIDNNFKNKYRILFVGNICEEKGIMTVLRSINTLKRSFDQIKLALAGPIIENGFYSKVTRFIKDNGLETFVYFLGQLNDDELKEEYKKASVFVFPTLQDVAPLALLQAMAAGKAIVATKTGGVPYIIDDGINGFLVQKKDSDSLANRIALFIDNNELHARLGANARKKALLNYTTDSVADKLYCIYKEFMNTRGISKC